MQASFLHFVLKKTTKNTSAGLLGQTRGFSRALVYLMAWGQVHLDQRHVELKLFLASALGAQVQAIIFFLFPAAMDFWPIGIFERYYANLFAWKIRLYITL